MENKLLKKILIGLTAIGPGLFLIRYNIGNGSITTMAKVGTEHGMTLTWALVLSCIFSYILMVAYGQTTLVTGKTALSTIKTSFKYGKILPLYILIALIVGEVLALMGIFGIVTDLIQEASIMLFFSLIIMAVSAGTLHVMGMKLNNTVEMISLFKPLGGKLAAIILIMGIVGAGVSSIFPIVLIAPWLISDYTGKPKNIRSPMYRILGLIGILFGFGMQFVDTTPHLPMVFSQAFQALILPAVAIPIFILINRNSLMNEYTAGTKMNIGLVLV